MDGGLAGAGAGVGGYSTRGYLNPMAFEKERLAGEEKLAAWSDQLRETPNRGKFMSWTYQKKQDLVIEGISGLLVREFVQNEKGVEIQYFGRVLKGRGYQFRYTSNVFQFKFQANAFPHQPNPDFKDPAEPYAILGPTCVITRESYLNRFRIEAGKRPLAGISREDGLVIADEIVGGCYCIANSGTQRPRLLSGLCLTSVPVKT